jgi:hypothetical protein
MLARLMSLLLCAVGLVSTDACAHHNRVQAQALSLAAEPFKGQVMELRHTNVFGEMYDDDEHWLATSYNFEDVYHRVDLFDRPIHPTVHLGQLPAGTQVRIEAVEQPSRLSWLTRMPSSPADHIWVRIRPLASEPLQTPLPERPMYVILPNPIGTPAELSHAVDQVLAPQGEVSGWLAALRPTQQVAIAHKDMVVGMHKRELTASVGEPWRWLEDRDAQGQPIVVAWYPGREAWLLGDAVIDVRAARRLR